ncbi:MAG: hypothetical protein KGI80_03265, partial [Verrucomicrobiota bacterium]|nr:hypothetical protein [Verrucomicrobiota bacterium]
LCAVMNRISFSDVKTNYATEGLSLVSDGCSVVRNSCVALSGALPFLGPVGKVAVGVIPGLYVAAGPLSLPIAVSGMVRSWKRIAADLREKNGALGLLHTLDFVGYGAFTGLISAMTLYGGALLSKDLSLAHLCGQLFNIFAPLFYVCFGVSALLRLGSSAAFLWKLESIASKGTERDEAFKVWLKEVGKDKNVLESLMNGPCATLVHRVIERNFELGSVEIDSLIQEMRIATHQQLFKQSVSLCIAALGISASFAGPFAPLIYAVSAGFLWPLIDSVDVMQWVSSGLEKRLFGRESGLPAASGVVSFYRGQTAKRDADVIEEFAASPEKAREQYCAQNQNEKKRTLFASVKEAKGATSEQKVKSEIKREMDAGVSYSDASDRSLDLQGLIEQVETIIRNSDDAAHCLDHCYITMALPVVRQLSLTNVGGAKRAYSISPVTKSKIKIAMQDQFCSLDSEGRHYSMRFEAVLNCRAECESYSFTAIPLHYRSDK